MRGVSTETRAAQNALIDNVNKLMNLVQHNPSIDDIPERRSLGEWQGQINSENCIELAENIIAYYNADDRAHYNFVDGLNRYQELVKKNLQDITRHLARIQQVDAVVKELDVVV
ncbi:MAG: hypothetical protein HY981_00175 [Candidatus Magasanikbacteria bacterium]|nr:hypothetical protein [Candidatus Magasanikbacteria bacterium]